LGAANLSQFDIKSDVRAWDPVPIGYLAMTTGYAALYIAMLLAIPRWSSQTDFK